MAETTKRDTTQPRAAQLEITQPGTLQPGTIHDQLEEMHRRVSTRRVSGGADDRELIERKQQQIIEGASSVLFEKGFHGTSIRDIARACDMSMGQLYHYISSKDDLIYLMHTHMQEMWYRHLTAAGFQEAGDPAARLEHGLRSSIAFLIENRDLVRFLYTESKYLDHLYLRQVLELDDQNVVGFYRILLADIPGLSLGEREREAAANLVAFMAVFLALRGWNLDMREVDPHVDYLVGFIFRGLGIERGSAPAEPGPAAAVSAAADSTAAGTPR